MAEQEKAVAASRPSAYRERNSTADRALDILGLFTPDRLKVSAIDVAAELSVARSTAYRYLLTLGSAGYLEEDPTGGFRLGLKVFELAKLARSSYGLSQLALPILRDLARNADETALLTRRSGSRAVCLEREEPTNHRVRLTYERGSAVPLNAGASAWVLLAWEDPDVIADLLHDAQLPRFTDQTLTSVTQVTKRLELIRQQGYAVTRGELDPDTTGIAAPVLDDQGRVVAGISLVAVSRRVPEEQLDELVGQVRAAASKLTELVALTSQ
jgi:DNA-binding IclR family transcriptional regulator